MTRFGLPVGPIGFADEVRIDILHEAFVGMGINYPALSNVVEPGRLGLKKPAKGFFLRKGGVDPEGVPLIAERELCERTEGDIQAGILIALARMGEELLDRQVVDDLGIELGLIGGIRFPADERPAMK